MRKKKRLNKLQVANGLPVYKTIKEMRDAQEKVLKALDRA